MKRAVDELLIAEYNRPPTYLECLSEKTRQAFLTSIGEQAVLAAKMYENSQLTYEEYERLEGGRVFLVCEIDAEKITLLATHSIQEARVLLNGFKATTINRE